MEEKLEIVPISECEEYMGSEDDDLEVIEF